MTDPSATPDVTDRAAAAAHLLTHPWISGARPDGSGVRITPHPHLLASRPNPGTLVAEHLDQWSEVYDLTYGTGTTNGGDFDLSGWRASDTGVALPAEHMADWLARTVSLVAGLRPRWVVELGCGTGMLLHRLAPHTAGYVGTDVAEQAVRTLSSSAPRQARVVRAAAHELTGPAVAAATTELGFPDGGPDCVLLNSVTQCFPDVGYLAAVLDTAVRTVSAGGHVVVGDNRHAGLLGEFSMWVARHRAPEVSAEQLAVRAAGRAERDEELLFDPIVLARVVAAAGRDVRMAVFPKLMRADSELTRYRFDAVLRVDPDEPVARPRVLRWSELDTEDWTTSLRTALSTSPTRVVGVPNGALAPDGTTPTAAALSEAVDGLNAVVTLAAYDPRELEVVSPPSAAWRPATEIAALPGGTAHEPLRRFARQRIAAAARAHLRGLPAMSEVDIVVDLDGGEAP